MKRIRIAPAAAGTVLLLLAGLAGPAAWSAGRNRPAPATTQGRSEVKRVVKTDAEWRRTLTPEQYRILRRKGTEIAFTGAYWNHHENGTYRCAGCGLELFGSRTKFDSGTGWPSFFQPVAPERVHIDVDRSLGWVREEVLCARCGGHLGHVFDDGPAPTHRRYCINSAALTFAKTKAPGEPGSPAGR